MPLRPQRRQSKWNLKASRRARGPKLGRRPRPTPRSEREARRNLISSRRRRPTRRRWPALGPISCALVGLVLGPRGGNVGAFFFTDAHAAPHPYHGDVVVFRQGVKLGDGVESGLVRLTPGRAPQDVEHCPGVEE